ncbi:MAG: TAXI family TRAP transporter solute-binding subunit [Aureliella sp.]
MDQNKQDDEDSIAVAQDRRAWIRNRVLPWIGLSLSLMCVVAGLMLYLGPRKARRHELRISAGSSAGLRSRFIDLLADGFARADQSDETMGRIELTFLRQPTDGSVDALRRVDSGQLDLAFVQGGLATNSYASVRQVATLHLEPLHLLVKASLYEETKDHLGALRGKTINVSSPGSGTYQLSKQILRFASLGDKDFVERNFGYAQLIGSGKAAESMPDAVFLVSTLPSPVAEYLISDFDYRLVPLPLSVPIRRTWLAQYRNADSSAQDDLEQALRRVDRLEIPAFTYQIDPPRPAQGVETIGTRMNLVAGKHVASEVVAEIAEAVYETEFARATEQKLRWDELGELAEFPLHAGAKTYLAGKQPLATRQVIEITEQLIGIFGAGIGTWLFLWQWLRRMRMRRKDAEFVSCIDRVVQIENEALGYEDDAEVPIQKLQEMQEELSEIKTRLIDRYRDGYLEGTEMLSSFLKHANDASELISRIVLQSK